MARDQTQSGSFSRERKEPGNEVGNSGDGFREQVKFSKDHRGSTTSIKVDQQERFDGKIYCVAVVLVRTRDQLLTHNYSITHKKPTFVSLSASSGSSPCNVIILIRHS